MHRRIHKTRLFGRPGIYPDQSTTTSGLRPVDESAVDHVLEALANTSSRNNGTLRGLGGLLQLAANRGNKTKRNNTPTKVDACVIIFRGTKFICHGSCSNRVTSYSYFVHSASVDVLTSVLMLLRMMIVSVPTEATII